MFEDVSSGSIPGIVFRNVDVFRREGLAVDGLRDGWCVKGIIFSLAYFVENYVSILFVKVGTKKNGNDW